MTLALFTRGVTLTSAAARLSAGLWLCSRPARCFTRNGAPGPQCLPPAARNTKRRSRNMTEQAMREMTLDEVLDRLPKPGDSVTQPHRAVRELRALRDENAFLRMALEVISRSESYRGDGVPLSVLDFASGVLKVTADQRGLRLVVTDKAQGERD